MYKHVVCAQFVLAYIGCVWVPNHHIDSETSGFFTLAWGAAGQFQARSNMHVGGWCMILIQSLALFTLVVGAAG